MARTGIPTGDGSYIDPRDDDDDDSSSSDDDDGSSGGGSRIGGPTSRTGIPTGGSSGSGSSGETDTNNDGGLDAGGWGDELSGGPVDTGGSSGGSSGSSTDGGGSSGGGGGRQQIDDSAARQGIEQIGGEGMASIALENQAGQRFTYSGPVEEVARRAEKQFLAENPDFTEEDVAVRQGDGLLTLELTQQGQQRLEDVNRRRRKEQREQFAERIESTTGLERGSEFTIEEREGRLEANLTDAALNQRVEREIERQAGVARARALGITNSALRAAVIESMDLERGRDYTVDFDRGDDGESVTVSAELTEGYRYDLAATAIETQYVTATGQPFERGADFTDIERVRNEEGDVVLSPELTEQGEAKVTGDEAEDAVRSLTFPNPVAGAGGTPATFSAPIGALPGVSEEDATLEDVLAGTQREIGTRFTEAGQSIRASGVSPAASGAMITFGGVEQAGPETGRGKSGALSAFYERGGAAIASAPFSILAAVEEAREFGVEAVDVARTEGLGEIEVTETTRQQVRPGPGPRRPRTVRTQQIGLGDRGVAGLVAEEAPETAGEIRENLEAELATPAGKVGFAGSLVLSAGIMGGAAAAGPRLGAATRYAIQPGEELASAGLTRAFPNVAARFPNQRIDNEEIVIRGISRGVERFGPAPRYQFSRRLDLDRLPGGRELAESARIELRSAPINLATARENLVRRVRGETDRSFRERAVRGDLDAGEVNAVDLEGEADVPTRGEASEPEDDDDGGGGTVGGSFEIERRTDSGVVVERFKIDPEAEQRTGLIEEEIERAETVSRPEAERSRPTEFGRVEAFEQPGEVQRPGVVERFGPETEFRTGLEGEMETEGEAETETELEMEFEGERARPRFDFEAEAETELELEFETETEGETEFELEGERGPRSLLPDRLEESEGSMWDRLFEAPIADAFDRAGRAAIFEDMMGRLNDWLAGVREDVNDALAGIGDVFDPDLVNNKNRLYKAPLSVHSSLEGVVTPIDVERPRYDYTPLEAVDGDLLVDAEEWAAGFTDDHTDAVAAVVATLWPDHSAEAGSWQDALAARLKELTEEEADHRVQRVGELSDAEVPEGLEHTDDLDVLRAKIEAIDVQDLARRLADAWDTDPGRDPPRFAASWHHQHKSGTSCFATPDYFVDLEEGGSGGGPLKLIARARGIIGDCSESLRGDAYWLAVNELRKEGYDIPYFTGKDGTHPDGLQLFEQPTDRDDARRKAVRAMLAGDRKP